MPQVYDGVVRIVCHASQGAQLCPARGHQATNRSVQILQVAMVILGRREGWENKGRGREGEMGWGNKGRGREGGRGGVGEEGEREGVGRKGKGEVGRGGEGKRERGGGENKSISIFQLLSLTADTRRK